MVVAGASGSFFIVHTDNPIGGSAQETLLRITVSAAGALIRSMFIQRPLTGATVGRLPERASVVDDESVDTHMQTIDADRFLSHSVVLTLSEHRNERVTD